jgi:hypothetical protein
MALQRLIGEDIFKVAGILEGDDSEVGRFKRRDSAISTWSRASDIPKSPNRTSTDSLKGLGRDSFAKANFLLLSSAPDSEICNFITTIRNTLIEVSDFYIPEPVPRKGNHRSSRQAALLPWIAPSTAGSTATFDSGYSVTNTTRQSLLMAPSTSGILSPPLSPGSQASDPMSPYADRSPYYNMPSSYQRRPESPAPSTKSGFSTASYLAETIRSYRRPFTSPKSVTSSSSTSRRWHRRGHRGSAHWWGMAHLYPEEELEEEEEEEFYDPEERRLMPMFMRREPPKTNGTSKAMRLLGIT